MTNRKKFGSGRNPTSKLAPPLTPHGDPSMTTAAFMADLKFQEAASIERNIEAGLLISGDELCRRLGLTVEALATTFARNHIFAVNGPLGELYYPAFFGNQKKYPFAALEKVCVALGDLSGNSKLSFFSAPLLSLGGDTPLDALAKGKIEAVTNAASAFSERSP